MKFMDRQTAGQALARKLRGKISNNKTVVVALPRGGVVLGFEVAKSLDAPLGVILVRKIGHPAFSEYAIAALAEGEKLVYNETGIMPVDELWMTTAEKNTRGQLARLRSLYFTQRYSQPDIAGSTAIIVDDGMATGLTMQAAVKAVRHLNPAKLVVAVPVASNESIELIEPVVDDVVVLDNPNNFRGDVSAHYLHFPQIKDLTVRQLLERSTTNGLRRTTTVNS
jgi:predicted phosphoribosyltransferase